MRLFSGHVGYITSVAFSPDGEFVLTGSWDKTAQLWEVATGETVRLFSGHSDFVTSVAFSPDGEFVLTGSRDGTALLWKVATGEIVRIFNGHLNFVNSVAFSPSGQFVLTGSSDHTARLWDTDYHDFIAYACTRVFRDFTDDERALYGILDNEPTCPQFAQE